MANLRIFVIGIAVLVSFLSSLTAATLSVGLNGGADYADIQTAIDTAKDGDTVLGETLGLQVLNEFPHKERSHD